MNFQQYALSFRKKALEATFSESEIQKCLAYAKPIIDRKLPVLYNTTHLAAMVGYKKVYVKKAALYTSYFYRKFTINKRNGRPRQIAEPLPSLMEIQSWILGNILEKIHVSKFAKAYIENRDIRDNAKYHIGKDVVLNLDIKDFFPSIKREYVERIFSQLGYSSNISNLLSKLCTLNNSIPQGAPTSPYLSNLYLHEFDNKVADFVVNEKIRYTRYADDLTFSGNFDPEPIIQFIAKELKAVKLSLNEAKTKIMKKNVQQMVTGVVVNEKMQISRKERQNLRLELHYLTTFGPESHKKATGNTKANYIHHVLGRINYLLMLNPDDKEFKNYRSIIHEKFLPNEV